MLLFVIYILSKLSIVMPGLYTPERRLGAEDTQLTLELEQLRGTGPSNKPRRQAIKARREEIARVLENMDTEGSVPENKKFSGTVKAITVLKARASQARKATAQKRKLAGQEFGQYAIDEVFEANAKAQAQGPALERMHTAWNQADHDIHEAQAQAAEDELRRKEWEQVQRRQEWEGQRRAWAAKAAEQVSLGDGLLQHGNIDGAEAAYQAAIALDPQNANAHDGLGDVLNNKGDAAGAEAAYRATIAIDPQHPHAAASLAGLRDEVAAAAAAAAAKAQAQQAQAQQAQAQAQAQARARVQAEQAHMQGQMRVQAQAQARQARQHRILWVEAQAQAQARAQARAQALRLGQQSSATGAADSNNALGSAYNTGGASNADTAFNNTGNGKGGPGFGQVAGACRPSGAAAAQPSPFARSAAPPSPYSSPFARSQPPRALPVGQARPRPSSAPSPFARSALQADKHRQAASRAAASGGVAGRGAAGAPPGGSARAGAGGGAREGAAARCRARYDAKRAQDRAQDGAPPRPPTGACTSPRSQDALWTLKELSAKLAVHEAAAAALEADATAVMQHASQDGRAGLQHTAASLSVKKAELAQLSALLEKLQLAEIDKACDTHRSLLSGRAEAVAHRKALNRRAEQLNAAMLDLDSALSRAIATAGEAAEAAPRPDNYPPGWSPG
jgi:hypothetical protein